MPRNAPIHLLLAASALLAGSALALADPPDPAPVPLSVDGAQQQFVFAYRLFQKSEDKLAAEAFDEFLTKFPNDARKGDAIYYRAFAARRMGDNELAAKLLNDVPPPTLVPLPAIAILRGQVYIDLGKFDNALAAIESLKLDTLDAGTRASAYYLQGVAYQATNNLEGATRAFTLAGDLTSPVQARALLELGKTKTTSGEPTKAIDAFSRCLALNDKDTTPAAARLMGDLIYQTGDFPKAIETYNLVLATDPGSDQYAPAVLGVLWSHLAAAQYDQVQVKASRFAKSLSGPDALKARHIVGLSFQNAGQDDKALEAFTAILQNADQSNTPYDWRDRTTYGLALSQYNTGKFDLMTASLAGFAQKYPKSTMLTDVQFLLAACDAKQGKPGAASARLTELVNRGKSDPAYFDALMRRARLNESTGQLSPAAADYVQYLAAARDANPPPPDAARSDTAIRLIDIQFALNQPDAALKTSKDLLTASLGPTIEPEVMFRLALAQIKLDKLDDSIATLGALITKYPQAPRTGEARYQRGLIYMAQDKPDDALPDLQAAAALTTLPDANRANALRLAGVRLREQSAMDVAAQTLTSLEKFGPLKPDETVWLVHYQLDHGQAQRAIEYAKRLFTVNPQTPDDIENDAEGRHLGALAFSQMGDNESALKALHQVMVSKASPALKLTAQLDLARTLCALGRTDEALKQYEPLIGAEPSLIASAALFESAGIYRSVADQRQRAGDASAKAAYEEARKLYKRIVLLYPFARLSPIPELSFIELYEIDLALGQKKQASAELKDLMEKFPNGPFCDYAQAMLAVAERKTPDALYILKKIPQTVEPKLIKRVNDRIRELGE